MMGQHDRSEALFYYFRLEDQVPETHLLRLIEKHISLAFVRERLKASYSETGRPSIDPELLLPSDGSAQTSSNEASKSFQPSCLRGKFEKFSLNRESLPYCPTEWRYIRDKRVADNSVGPLNHYNSRRPMQR